MARSNRSESSPEPAYAGEVWTDARGRATVTLPDPPAASSALRFKVRTVDVLVGARVVSELIDGRFTIETDEPNVRVSWRARLRAGARHRGREA